MRVSRIRWIAACLVALIFTSARALPQCPTGIQQAILAPPQPQASGYFGRSVAIDGNTAVVGSDGSSSVFVYRRSGADWALEAVLVDTIGSLSAFGQAVAIQGNRIAVGAPTSSPNQSGAVAIFERTGTTWTETAVIQPTPDIVSIGSWFGRAVALDGSTLVVGAPNAGTEKHDTFPGAVYVYVLSAGTWNFETRLYYSTGLAWFGISVAVKGDTLVAGRPGSTLFGNSPGNALIFRRNAGQWTLQQTLSEPSDFFFNSFGAAVAFDGTRVVVGASGGNQPAATGTATVFIESGGTWVVEAELVSADAAAQDGQGGGIALSGDTCVVGAPGRDDLGTNSGAAYVYRRSGSTWTEVGKLTTSDEVAGDFVGGAIALSGTSLCLGTLYHDGSAGPDAGAAYAFALTGEPRVYCTAQTNSQGCIPSVSSSGTPSASSTSPFVISCANIVNHKTGILIYGVQGPASIPFGAGGTLCVSPSLVRTPAQNSGGSMSGTDCTGVLSFDFNAWVQLGTHPNLVAGAIVNGQFWSRDPQSVGGTNLSDAIEFVLCP